MLCFAPILRLLKLRFEPYSFVLDTDFGDAAVNACTCKDKAEKGSKSQATRVPASQKAFGADAKCNASHLLFSQMFGSSAMALYRDKVQ